MKLLRINLSIKKLALALSILIFTLLALNIGYLKSNVLAASCPTSKKTLYTLNYAQPDPRASGTYTIVSATYNFTNANNTCVASLESSEKFVIDSRVNDGKMFIVSTMSITELGTKADKVIRLSKLPSDIKEGDTVSATIGSSSISVTRQNSGNIDPLKQLGITNGKVVDTTNDESTTDTTGSTTCAINGVGWILCPVFNFLGNIADGAYSFISTNFLQVDTKIVDTSSATYDAWSQARTFANLGLVVMFLIIIFSQITSFGISNYGIKKMLPRLIISAILINISFYVVQLVIDLSNILGNNIYSLFKDLSGQISASNPLSYGDSRTGEGGAGWAGLIAVAIGGGAAAVVFWPAIASLLPVLLLVVLALVGTLFVLVTRQVIIILLVIISPLAFLAFLLPNTESLFTKWRKTLTTLLLLYPIIALVFGASSFASALLTNVYTFSSDSNGTFGQIVAAAIGILPLFVVPTLLKNSLNAIPMAGKFANKLAGGDKLGKRFNAAAKEGYQKTDIARSLNINKARSEQKRQAGWANRMQKNRILGAPARLGALGNTDAVKAQAFSAVDKAEEQAVTDASSLLDHMQQNAQPLDNDQLKALMAGQDVDITDANGNRVTRKASEFNRYHRMAAAKKLAPQTRGYRDAVGFANAAAHATDPAERAHYLKMANDIPAVKDSPTLGRAMGQIQSGIPAGQNIDMEQFRRDAIVQGKYTADSFTSIDTDELSDVLATAQSTPFGSDERRILQQAYAAYSANPQLHSKVAAGGQRDLLIQATRSL